MPEDWAAVARVMRDRKIRLGLSQREIQQRSGVSLSIVRELLNNTHQRQRHGRTLEAVSKALDLPSDYLNAVLVGEVPPSAESSAIASAGAARPDPLIVVGQRLAELVNEIHDLKTVIATALAKIDSGWRVRTE